MNEHSGPIPKDSVGDVQLYEEEQIAVTPPQFEFSRMRWLIAIFMIKALNLDSLILNADSEVASGTRTEFKKDDF